MDVEGGVYFPQDRHLTPDRFVTEMQEPASGDRASISSGTPKSRAGASSGRSTCARRRRRDGREIEGDEFVLCGGSWSPGLVRELGLKLPIEAGKGYSLTLPAPKRSPAICAILSEARVAVTPMGGALRFAGTMEIAGLDERITPVRVRSIIAAATTLLSRDQGVGFRRRRAVARACGRARRTGLPYVGRTARFANLSIARRPCDDGHEPRSRSRA